MKELKWEVVAYSGDPMDDPIKSCDSKRAAIALAKRLIKDGYSGVEVHAHNGAEIIDSTIIDSF